MAVYRRDIEPGHIFGYYYFITGQTNGLFAKPVNYHEDHVIALLVHGHGLEIHGHMLPDVVGDGEGF